MPTLAEDEYDALIRRIHERFAGMSKTNQRIAEYLTQNPSEVAVKSVNALADACGIHASTFVRFAQALGFRGFRELQTIFQNRLSTTLQTYEGRTRSMGRELESSAAPGDFARLQQLVRRDSAAVAALADEIPPEDFTAAIDLLAAADTVFLMGQLRSAPVVEILRYYLTMLGTRTVMLDPSGGLARHMARTMRAQDLLIVVSFRHYADEPVAVAEDAAARGVPILAITDSTLSPVARCATLLFPVPERDSAPARSLAAPVCLAQALTLALAARQQHAVQPRMPTVTGA